MKVSDLMPGILVKPKSGFAWHNQMSAHLDKIMCITVVPIDEDHKDDSVVMYVGERTGDNITYGKQLILWGGKKISVNPSAWRNMIIVN
jgi:fructose-1,6-bisphosphatase/sedoheptulose 1,7-bisphosphatase-like protein